MTPTAGTIAGCIVMIIGVLVLIAGALGLTRWLHVRRVDTWQDDGWAFFGFPAVFVGLLMTVIPLINFAIIGFGSDYLYLHPVKGQVQAVASRQVSDGKAMSVRYVVKIDGNPYAVDDTRAALLKPGDSVSLVCSREFVWGSTDNGWGCDWSGQ